ncbi:eCIS core domain-containing protein [Streptomyces sp. NPDC004270]
MRPDRSHEPAATTRPAQAADAPDRLPDRPPDSGRVNRIPLWSLAGSEASRSAGASGDAEGGAAPITAVGRPADRRPGRPLDPVTRTEMESLFATDLGGVRVHTDAQADDSARALDANAWTSGDDISFARGQYAPGSDAGKWLLRHELTHVVQQRSRPPATPTRVSAPYEPTERVADAIAAGTRSGAALAGTADPHVVHRQARSAGNHAAADSTEGHAAADDAQDHATADTTNGGPATADRPDPRVVLVKKEHFTGRESYETLVKKARETPGWHFDPAVTPQNYRSRYRPGPGAQGEGGSWRVLVRDRASTDAPSRTEGGGAVTTWDSRHRGRYVEQNKAMSKQAVEAIAQAAGEKDAAKAMKIAEEVSTERATARTATQKKLSPGGRALSEAVDTKQDFAKSAEKYRGRLPSAEGGARIPPESEIELARRIAVGAGETQATIKTLAKVGRVVGPVMIAVGVVLGVRAIVQAPEGQRGRVAAREVGAFAGGVIGASLGTSAGVAIATFLSAFLLALGIIGGPVAWVMATVLGVLGGLIGAWWFSKRGGQVGEAVYDAAAEPSAEGENPWDGSAQD